MSEENQTDQASKEEASATSEEQPSVEALNNENQDTVPANNEDASESSKQPIESELEKARKAAAKANIENRRLRREAKQREAAKVEPKQEETAPVVPDVTVPEDLLIDPDRAVGFVRETVQKSIIEDRKAQEEMRKKQEESQKVDTFWNKSDELAAEDEEYSELVDTSHDVQMSQILTNSLVQSEVGAKLHKHVLQNPDVLLKINTLSLQYPKAARDEIARIEATLSNESQGQKKNNITKAPPPIDTAGSRSGATPSAAKAGSMEEYYARRMAEKLAKA